MAPVLQSALGVSVFIALAWAVSEERRAFPWRIVLAGLALQFALAGALLKLPWIRGWVLGLNEAMLGLERATEAGTAFVFGYLGGGPLPFEEVTPGTSFVIAFRVLPLILVVSALSSLLFYWRILPFVVRVLSRILEKTLGIGGAVGLSAAADVFVGMVEAPLLVRPYLGALSRGELFSLMSCGMATIAGTVMVLYASILGEVVPEAMGHILTASLINTPGALLIAAVMVPSVGPATAGELGPAETARSSMDAITSGTLAGIALLINIVALLVVFVALVSLADGILGVLLPDIGRRARDATTPARDAHDPSGVARGDPLGRGPDRRGPHGDQDGAERAGRLSRPRALTEGCIERAQHRDHDLRPVRVREPREPRDPDRRSRHHGPGTARRGHRPRSQVHRFRDADHLIDRCHRRCALVLSTRGLSVSRCVASRHSPPNPARTLELGPLIQGPGALLGEGGVGQVRLTHSPAAASQVGFGEDFGQVGL